MNEEEKKAIEELSKKAVICKYESRDYPNMICFKKDMIIVLNLIEKLQKENEELKEDRDKFKKALGKRITYCNELEKDLFENCSNYVIPKQIVKDKIEEYKNEIDKLYNQKVWNEPMDTIYNNRYVNYINILQELLEKRQ
jgi:hypothetical protein